MFLLNSSYKDIFIQWNPAKVPKKRGVFIFAKKIYGMNK